MKTERQIVRLTKRPELLETAAGWFHKKWGIPLAVYQSRNWKM